MYRMLPLLALFGATPAAAQEVFAGALIHGVDTPLTFETGEGGVDFQLGWRGAPLKALAPVGSPSPYAFSSLNSRGDTNFVAAGLSWTIGKGALYVRPGIGVALHDGPSYRVRGGFQTQLAPTSGAMGYGVPSAVAAKVVHPDRPVVAPPNTPGSRT